MRSRPLLLALASIAAVAALSLSAPARPVRDDDDDEARAAGRRTFVENCLICHGEDMTSKQRLTSKQWAAEVDKMIGWGAPVPPEQKDGVVAHLIAGYSESVPPPAPDLASADDLLRVGADLGARPTSAGDPSRGGVLYARHCANCHGPAASGGDLGPILADRPVLVRDDAYHTAVRKGVRRMPGFAALLSKAEEDDLLAWLRGQRADTASRRP